MAVIDVCIPPASTHSGKCLFMPLDVQRLIYDVSCLSIKGLLSAKKAKTAQTGDIYKPSRIHVNAGIAAIGAPS